MMHPDKRQTIILALAVAVIAGGLLVWRFNLAPEIGKFFAAEPATTLHLSIENPEAQAFVITRPSYDYAPGVMKDGDTYKMWWCAGGFSQFGDEIAYSTAPSANGPWSPAIGVFHGTGNTGTNGQPVDDDGSHVCDPSIVRVNGTYYMYYTGGVEAFYDTAGNFYSDVTEAIKHAPVYQFPGGPMVATSTDGIHWTRGNSGKIIVRANVIGGESGFEDLPASPHPVYPDIRLVFGAGQPSAVYKDGYFYLMFTDTTGKVSNRANGAGMYVVRSRDPFFQSGVEELIAPGTFAPRTPQNRTSYALMQDFQTEMQYSDELKAFIVAGSFGRGTAGGDVIRFRFFDETFGREVTDPVKIQMNWFGGPGMASDPEGHSISAGPGRIRLDVFVAHPSNGVIDDVFATDINHAGGTLKIDSLPTGTMTLSATPGSLACQGQAEVPTVLQWTSGAPWGATSYVVKRATTSGGPYEIIDADFPGGPYYDTAQEGTFFYVTSAVNAAGLELGISNEAQVTVAPLACASPTVTVTVSASPSPTATVTVSVSPTATATAGTKKPGDIDGNGKVDIFDYNTMVTQFGSIGYVAADLDGNGKVDIFDYNVVVSNFGK